MHRRVVVAGRDAFDVVAAIVRLQRPFRAEHHAGSHGGLAAGVTDIEALQALRRLRQVERLGKGFEACRHMLAVGQACAQGLFGVGHRQLLPAGAGTTHPVADLQFAASRFGDRRNQHRKSSCVTLTINSAGRSRSWWLR